jgi:hypothetical protein
MAFLIGMMLCLVGLFGCTGAVVNTAQVYQPVTGVIQMDIQVPASEQVVKVQFYVDDALHSEDETAADGFAAELDTGEFEPESLVKISAKGVRANNTTLLLRENFILVGKLVEAEATTESEAATETEASAETETEPATEAAD